MSVADLAPFDFFKLETSNQDVVVRTSAMGKVAFIASLLGPEKARMDLLPYLQSKVSTELDQVLLAMASKLGIVLPLVGGPEQAHSLAALLEELCGVEEVTVRNAATSSMGTILSQLGANGANAIQAGVYLDVLKRLVAGGGGSIAAAASGEEPSDLFYCRVAGAQIVPDVYRVVSEADKASVLQLYTKLIEDESPLVQRAAANSFLKLASFADVNTLKGELSTTIKQLIEIENTTVKVIAIESLASFLSSLRNATGSTNDLKSNFSPLVKELFMDPSWRIRQAIAKNVGQLVECYKGDTEEIMVTLRGAIGLMVDPEPDVRILTIKSITSAVTEVGADAFLAEYIPIAEKITDDPMSSVRKALADTSVDLVGKVGAANVAQSLSGLIVKLMGDDDPLVRLRILKKIHVIAEEAPGLCTRLTEPLKSMFSDSNWRVRKQLAVSTPALVQHLGCDYFSTHTLPHFVALLKDGVDEVRVACAASLSAIAKVVDINWAFENLFPSLKEMSTDEYLIRLTMLTALEGLLSMELPDKFYGEALALALAATRDRVPNVRLRAAQILGVIAIANENCRGSVRPTLSDLQSHDKDKDVKYFASEALRLIPANG